MIKRLISYMAILLCMVTVVSAIGVDVTNNDNVNSNNNVALQTSTNANVRTNANVNTDDVVLITVDSNGRSNYSGYVDSRSDSEIRADAQANADAEARASSEDDSVFARIWVNVVTFFSFSSN